MGKLTSVLVLACLCLSASAQKPESCRAAAQHLTLPESAYVDGPIGFSRPPLVFMFSQDGIDVYSATSFDLLSRLDPSVRTGVRIILVYQDEKARQHKIDSLRGVVNFGNAMVPLRHAPLANLKFAVVDFERTPIWVDNVLTRKWLISSVEYFEPEACIVFPSDASDQMRLEWTKPNLQASQVYFDWITGITYPSNKRASPDSDPVLAKSIQVMHYLLQHFGIQD